MHYGNKRLLKLPGNLFTEFLVKPVAENISACLFSGKHLKRDPA